MYITIFFVEQKGFSVRPWHFHRFTLVNYSDAWLGPCIFHLRKTSPDWSPKMSLEQHVFLPKKTAAMSRKMWGIPMEFQGMATQTTIQWLIFLILGFVLRTMMRCTYTITLKSQSILKTQHFACCLLQFCYIYIWHTLKAQKHGRSTKQRKRCGRS